MIALGSDGGLAPGCSGSVFLYSAPSEMVQESLAPSEMLACSSCCGWLRWQIFWLVGRGLSVRRLGWRQMEWPVLGFGGLVSVRWLRDVRRQQRMFLALHNGVEKIRPCRQCVRRLSWRRRRDGSGSVWVRVRDTSRLHRGCPRCACRWEFVDYNSGSRWCKRSFVIVEGSVELCFGG